MRFPKNYIFLLFNFFLAGLTAYMIGSAISTYLNYQLISLPLLPLSSYEFENEKLPNDIGETKESFDIILERNIFYAQKTEIDVPELLYEEGLEELKKIDDIKVENTLLDIALSGTMIYGEQNSFAFISKKNNLNKYVIFGIGECFNVKNVQRDESCLEDSAKVLQIKDRWVLIIFQGEKQALRMLSHLPINELAEESTEMRNIQNQNISQKKKSSFIPSERKKKLTKIFDTKKGLSNGSNIFHFKRVWVDEQLANFEQLLNDARVVPIKKDEKPYFMFQFIKKESIYEKLGLHKNDIILEINGFIVDSVAKALKLLEVLQSEREISLKVERDGKPENFHYYIN